MTYSLDTLKEIIEESCDDSKVPVLVHPDEVGRAYTIEELQAVRARDFETRLLITGKNIQGQTLMLRTHYTDNHKYSCHLNYVRDYFKAFHATKNNTAAKATLTDLLTMFFTCDHSKYYSFALTMASGLSNQGKNTTFEIDHSMVKEKSQMDEARQEFCLLMNIIFENIAIERFLVDDNGSNTFRLAYCQSKHTKEKAPLFLATFSFLLQVCLAGYVLAEIFVTDSFGHVRNVPLAILTFIYSTILAYPIISDSSGSNCLYRKKGLLYFMDSTVNIILPCVLLFAGFMVIMIQDSFIECVLNTAALLFIPEIDDQLPSLLGIKEEAIIHNYLISQSIKQYDKAIRKMNQLNGDISGIDLLKTNPSIGVQFNDFYITNIPEQGSEPYNGELFQPYQIQVTGNGTDYQIDPSSYVTEHCLIKRMIWSYTTAHPMSTKPRVGYLKLEKMNGEVIEIKEKGTDNESVGVSDVRYALTGAFIITTFQMSNAIIRLRVCGSYKAADFLSAFEYYSLWNVSEKAKALLLKPGGHETNLGKGSANDDYIAHIS